mmetsp:Transcript_118544/g.335354  ORF Transcript_118544/g.335354 Transcript_118544/m.335354 type:complete len:237 (+) Transcript_118544:68-778(+)
MVALFSCSGSNCRPCFTADPTTDVVKVDMALGAPQKENVGPTGGFLAAQEAERERQEREVEAETRRQKAVQAAMARREAERTEAERQAQEDADRRRRQAAEERQRLQAEEQARRRAEEERLAREAALQMEREAEAAEEEHQRLERARNDQAKLDAFLKKNNYKGVNEKRTTAMRAKYPLHTAIKQKDGDVVRILLEAGADLGVTDSNKLTPLQLVTKLNTDGSFTAIHNQLLRAGA